MLRAPGPERGNDGILDIAEHRVDGPEFRMTSGFPTGAGDDRFVCTTRVRNAIEAAEPVGDDPGTAHCDPASDFLDVLLREPPYAPQLHALRLAIGGGLDGGDKWCFSRAAASALAAAALPAEIGIVHLDAALERLLLVPLQHHLPELVVHRPGRVVADIDAPRQLERRDALLGLRHVEHGPEPHR